MFIEDWPIPGQVLLPWRSPRLSNRVCMCVCACAHVSTHTHALLQGRMSGICHSSPGGLAIVTSVAWRVCVHVRALVYTHVPHCRVTCPGICHSSPGGLAIVTPVEWCVCVCVRVLVQGHMPGICLRSSGSSGWQFCGVACMPTQEVGFMVPPPPAQRTSWSWSLW